MRTRKTYLVSPGAVLKGLRKLYSLAGGTGSQTSRLASPVGSCNRTGARETGPLNDLRPEKENPAQARGKSQVRRMSGQLGDWGNLKAVQPALHTVDTQVATMPM
jgi:hypothetical protein